MRNGERRVRKGLRNGGGARVRSVPSTGTISAISAS